MLFFYSFFFIFLCRGSINLAVSDACVVYILNDCLNDELANCLEFFLPVNCQSDSTDEDIPCQ